MWRALQVVVRFAAAAALWASCSPQPVAGPIGDGVLVLEVGGKQPSLRASLEAVGRTVAPPRVLREPSDPDANTGWPQVPRLEEPVPPPAPVSSDDPVGDSPPDAPAAVEAQWTTVELPEGETLIHVARRHLGDGRRYTDLLRWNGWTEGDARRLPPGQKVKIMLSDNR